MGNTCLMVVATEAVHTLSNKDITGLIAAIEKNNV
jgi:hypothetical protein